MITACIVARDEAEHLPACIASVRDAVEEVLLVDNGSRDDTVAVARKEGARVIHFDGNHEQARNAYLEAATTDWLFVIDADERLASPLPPTNDDIDGYAIERHDFIGSGRWASTRLVRFFRRAPHVRYFDSKAHAAVAPSLQRIALANTVVHHLDALLVRDHEAKRANMRARLERELNAGASRTHPILRCFYALELFAIEDDTGASKMLEAALAISTRLEPIVSLFRAQQHRGRGRFEEAEKWARHCLSLESDVFRGRDSAWAVLADAVDQQGRDANPMVAAARAESPGVLSHFVNERALAGDPLPRSTVPDFAYRPGARPSIFVQQDALLTRYRPT